MTCNCSKLFYCSKHVPKRNEECVELDRPEWFWVTWWNEYNRGKAK